MSEASDKKNVQKLQRAIVDGLQDVKAQDIRVFNTEHMSPLFERVIVASGTSNRQTKALASSVRDKVRESGFAKPRVEGEDNGEWIIVDCGPAVAHIMQPAIRHYYNLEEIWGDKPVHLRGPGTAPARKGADSKTKTAAAGTGQAQPAIKKVAARKPATTAQPAAKKAAAKKAPARSAPSRKAAAGAAPARKAAVGAAPSARAGGARPAPARKKVPSGAAKPLAQRVVGKPKPAAAARPAAKKAVAKKTPGRARG
ncbi:ribosome silencing factor [Ottowia sp.]|uniref:ribosome silencing factor n=1 Tax=Ottowia sp. TaxID=1898956 RepID=UPI00262DAB0D|nr:ribosome silencing factor [Ottowia sp.]